MRKLITLSKKSSAVKAISICFFILFYIGGLDAQTINPSCYSNAHCWTITKIENNYDGTYVYLNYYSYKSDYSFLIPTNMYIENYDNPYDKKCYIKSFSNNEMNKDYSLNPFTDYDFVLKFDKIPNNWKNINITSPQKVGYTSWYFNYITLNLPSSQRLKFDNFILNNGIEVLSDFAHPLNTFRRAKYNVDYDKARVTIYYQNYTIDLKLEFSGNYIKRIAVMYDDDYDKNFIWAFSGLELLRNAILKQSNYNDDVSTVEQIIGKYTNQMSGEELATALLDLIILLK